MVVSRCWSHSSESNQSLQNVHIQQCALQRSLGCALAFVPLTLVQPKSFLHVTHFRSFSYCLQDGFMQTVICANGSAQNTKVKSFWNLFFPQLPRSGDALPTRKEMAVVLCHWFALGLVSLPVLVSEEMSGLRGLLIHMGPSDACIARGSLF